jgi:hypothetical protein
VAQMEALPHAVSQCENLKKPRFEKSNLGGTVLPVPLNSGIGKCGTSPFCILRGSTFFIQICVESEMVRECCYPSRQTKNMISGCGLLLHRSGCGLPLPPRLLVLGRPSFFKPSGVWQTIPSLPGSAGPDIHASWGWNRKCASLGESRTEIVEFHQWGAVNDAQHWRGPWVWVS